MVTNRRLIWLIVFFLVLTAYTTSSEATLYPVEIFTNNGNYYDSSEWAVYVEVTEPQLGQVNFTFFNNNLFNSSVARIYFEDGALLDIASIIEGPETAFSKSKAPKSLPAGKTLTSPFESTMEFSIGAEPSPAHNGINPGEWLTITFDLQESLNIDDVIGQINTGSLRIGAHIIALPDGSSESAIFVPEPAAILLLGLGGIGLFRKQIMR